jgi:hypothetical protein
LLRGACQRAGQRPDPLARNDELNFSSSPAMTIIAAQISPTGKSAKAVKAAFISDFQK